MGSLRKKPIKAAMRKDFATEATEIGWLGFPALAGPTGWGQHPVCHIPEQSLAGPGRKHSEGLGSSAGTTSNVLSIMPPPPLQITKHS